jgi:hypothetical protein
LIKTYEWLEIEYTDKKKEHLIKRILRNSEYAFLEADTEECLNSHYIIRKEGRKDMPWFSDDGFKMLCCLLPSPKSKYILQYFIHIEKEYWRVLNQSFEETQLELEKITTKLEKTKSILLNTENENEKYVGICTDQKIKLNNYAFLNEIMDNREFFTMSGNIDYQNYRYFQETYMVKLPIYVVDTKHIANWFNNNEKNNLKKRRKPKVVELEFTDDDECDVEQEELQDYDVVREKYELLEYSQPFNYYTLHDLQNNDEVLYMYLELLANAKQNKERTTKYLHKAGYIYILDNDHLRDVKKMLNADEMNYSPVKNIYKTTYSTIMDNAKTSLNKRLYKLAKKENILKV